MEDFDGFDGKIFILESESSVPKYDSDSDSDSDMETEDINKVIILLCIRLCSWKIIYFELFWMVLIDFWNKNEFGDYTDIVKEQQLEVSYLFIV